MNLTALKQAKAEALRFVKRVNALELSQPRGFSDYLNGSKHTGAVKRASMDLTRSLSELRKPG
jgi:hypothetical protein